ncbi:hypothetical protein CBR_g68671 [Chara braunii]|uniref:Uncharacterized protein n=1 Tax=Chara braunii TaxID=69332 RepID=A0A388K9I0_CHABU|nr:hypothetical protein CBR_g68671 [Chara braunii]|eukprot:GBG66687.1 hypothetical protein CBR_g68671 [Chara braunii]
MRFHLTTCFDADGNEEPDNYKQVSLHLQKFVGYGMRAAAMHPFDKSRKKDGSQVVMLRPFDFLKRIYCHKVSSHVCTVDSKLALSEPLIPFDIQLDEFTSKLRSYELQALGQAILHSAISVGSPDGGGDPGARQISSVGITERDKVVEKSEPVQKSDLSPRSLMNTVSKRLSPGLKQWQGPAEVSSLRHDGGSEFGEDLEKTEDDLSAEQPLLERNVEGNEGHDEDEDNQFTGYDEGDGDEQGVGDGEEGVEDEDGGDDDDGGDDKEDGDDHRGLKDGNDDEGTGRLRSGDEDVLNTQRSVCSRKRKSRASGDEEQRRRQSKLIGLAASEEAYKKALDAQSAKAAKEKRERPRSSQRPKKKAKTNGGKEVADSGDEAVEVDPRDNTSKPEQLVSDAIDTTRCFFLRYDDNNNAIDRPVQVFVDVRKILPNPDNGEFQYNHRPLNEMLVASIKDAMERPEKQKEWDKNTFILTRVIEVTGNGQKQWQRLKPKDWRDTDVSSYHWYAVAGQHTPEAAKRWDRANSPTARKWGVQSWKARAVYFDDDHLDGDFTAGEKEMALDLILAEKVVVTTGRTFAKKLMNMNDLYTEVRRERYMVRMFNYVLFKSECRGQREWNDDFFIGYDDIMKRFEPHGKKRESLWKYLFCNAPDTRTETDYVAQKVVALQHLQRYHDAKIGAIEIFLARCEDLWFNKKMCCINARIYNEALEPKDRFDIMDSEKDTDDDEIDLPLPDVRNHATDKNMCTGSLSGGDPAVVEVGGPTMTSCKTAQLTHTQTSSAGDGTEASTSKWKDKRGAPGFPTLMWQMFDHVMKMPTENQTRGQHDDAGPGEDDMCREDNPLFHIPNDEDKDLTPGDEIESHMKESKGGPHFLDTKFTETEVYKWGHHIIWHLGVLEPCVFDGKWHMVVRVGGKWILKKRLSRSKFLETAKEQLLLRVLQANKGAGEQDISEKVNSVFEALLQNYLLEYCTAFYERKSSPSRGQIRWALECRQTKQMYDSDILVGCTQAMEENIRNGSRQGAVKTSVAEKEGRERKDVEYKQQGTHEASVDGLLKTPFSEGVGAVPGEKTAGPGCGGEEAGNTKERGEKKATTDKDARDAGDGGARRVPSGLGDPLSATNTGMSSHGGRSGGQHDAGDALVFRGASPRDTTKPLADNRDEGDKLLHMVCTDSGSQIAPDSMEREEGGGMEGVCMTHGREAEMIMTKLTGMQTSNTTWTWTARMDWERKLPAVADLAAAVRT